MLPQNSPRLDDLVVRLAQAAAALGASVHPLTARPLVNLLRQVNSSYSNLIEGHRTQLADIARAVRADYSADPAKRALQRESAAHIEVERLIDKRLENEPDLDICTADFLCWIHRRFYEGLPEEFLRVESPSGRTRTVVPGELRDEEVTVGQHLAPPPATLPSFLARFHEAYSPEGLTSYRKIVAAAASHHRLLWVHPFLDGNGRVARLFTHAYLQRAKVGGLGLWSASRGLARRRDRYREMLAVADGARQGDLDGRGPLSDRGLARFCEFFLETAIDQVDFMRASLRLETLEAEIDAYFVNRGRQEGLDLKMRPLLREVFLRGEVARGEVPRICGMAERTARRSLGVLLEQGLLWSETDRGPLRLGFPTKVVSYWLPQLTEE